MAVATVTSREELGNNLVKSPTAAGAAGSRQPCATIEARWRLAPRATQLTPTLLSLLGLARFSKRGAAGVGQRPRACCVCSVTVSGADRERKDESAIPEMDEDVAHSIRALTEQRRDVLVGKRTMALQQRKNRPLHPTILYKIKRTR